MAMVGYARVSTDGQSLDVQKDALKKEGCSKVFEEKASGAKTDREELRKCLEYLREGDTLIVYKLDRLGRTTRQLIELVEDLRNRGVNFKAITNGIDTTTAQGRFFFTIMAGFSEMEAELIRERTRAGLESARARGRKGGRPAMDPAKLNRALKLYDSKTHTVKEITEITGVSKPKLYQALKERRQDQTKD